MVVSNDWSIGSRGWQGKHPGRFRDLPGLVSRENDMAGPWLLRGRLASLGVVLALSAGCARTPPEEALRARVAALEEAIDARDAGALREFLAEDFIGPGGMDEAGARRLAQGMFLRFRDIGTQVGPLEVEVQDGRARVGFDAVVTGGANAMLPQSGQLYDVRTAWRLEDGEWRLLSVEWTPATGAP
jgi:hypothetical protein